MEPFDRVSRAALLALRWVLFRAPRRPNMITDTIVERRLRADVPGGDRDPGRLPRRHQAMADEDGDLSSFVLQAMLENWEAAKADRRPMCADTGVPRYYVKSGNEAGSRAVSSGSSAPLRHRTYDPRHPAPPQPGASPLAHGPRQQCGPRRAGDRIQLRAERRLGRHHHVHKGCSAPTTGCCSPPTGSTASSDLSRCDDRFRQARPRLPAGHHRHRPRRLKDTCRAWQAGRLPSHRR